ncbi:MAG: hypothetical protein IKR81_15835, partial [Victivallales bacterium]|nr:hypothetical protein [Victivallales bacterium]
MKDKSTLVYQLLCIVLLIALIRTALCKKSTSTASTEPTAVPTAVPTAQQPAPSAPPPAVPTTSGWKRIAPSEIPDNAIDLIDNYKG